MAFNLFGWDQSQIPQYQAPQGYQNPFSGQQQGLINQQLSGVLSPAQLGSFRQQFGQNLAQANQSSFGMPSGASASLNANVAAQKAQQQQLFGTQLQQQGFQNAGQMNQFGLQQQQLQDQNSLEAYKSQLNAWQTANDPSNQGLFGNLIGAGTNFALNSYTPLKNFGWGGKGQFLGGQ